MIMENTMEKNLKSNQENVKTSNETIEDDFEKFAEKNPNNSGYNIENLEKYYEIPNFNNENKNSEENQTSLIESSSN